MFFLSLNLFFRNLVIVLSLIISSVVAQQYQQPSQFTLNQNSREHDAAHSSLTYRARPYQYSSSEEGEDTGYVRRKK